MTHRIRNHARAEVDDIESDILEEPDAADVFHARLRVVWAVVWRALPVWWGELLRT
jgi:hypothetical protein